MGNGAGLITNMLYNTIKEGFPFPFKVTFILNPIGI